MKSPPERQADQAKVAGIAEGRGEQQVKINPQASQAVRIGAGGMRMKYHEISRSAMTSVKS
jgi:hypothetical protein